MLDNCTYPADIFPSSRFYHEDLGDPPLELVRLPNGVPGIQAFDRIPAAPARSSRAENCRGFTCAAAKRLVHSALALSRRAAACR